MDKKKSGLQTIWNKPKVLDLIWGDFGRPATVRYFQLFSRLEKDKIKNIIHPLPFFDEYRRIEYLIVGNLPFWKQKWLEKFALNNSSLNPKILAGVEDGIPVEELIPPFLITLSFLSPYIISKNLPTRFILPCNTLSKTTQILKELFSTPTKIFEKKIKNFLPENSKHWKNLYSLHQAHLVKFYPLIPEIILYLKSKKYDRIFLVGTEETVQQYSEYIEKEEVPLKIKTFSNKNKNLDVILKSIAREGKVELEVENTGEDIYLSACTDVKVEGWLDSLEIYAESLINKIYD